MKLEDIEKFEKLEDAFPTEVTYRDKYLLTETSGFGEYWFTSGSHIATMGRRFLKGFSNYYLP